MYYFNLYFAFYIFVVSSEVSNRLSLGSFREALPDPSGSYPGFHGAVARPRGQEQGAEEPVERRNS